jgi:hypothetical protein
VDLRLKRGSEMRFKIVAFFLCTGVTAICQSTAPALVTPQKPVVVTQDAQSWTNCEKLTPDLAIPSFAPHAGKRRSSASATWHWDDAQVNSKNAFHAPVFGSAGQINSKSAFPSPVLNAEAQSCTLVAQNGLPSFYQTLSQPWPNAKAGPIPTQWPNAKIERIPTEWPNLEFVPVNTATVPPQPSK